MKALIAYFSHVGENIACGLVVRGVNVDSSDEVIKDFVSKN